MNDNIKEPLLFGGAFIGIIVAGAIFSPLGFIALVAFLLFSLPRFWRWATVFNTDRELKRRQDRIETAIIQGQVDGKLTQRAAQKLHDRGEL